MLKLNDLLPLVEPKTLVLFAKKKGVDIDNLSPLEMVNALSLSQTDIDLSRSELFKALSEDEHIWLAYTTDVSQLVDVLSIADKKVIVDTFAIPLDINADFGNALRKFTGYQIKVEEMQEFYVFANKHGFKLKVSKCDDGFVLANDDSKDFFLYPAEVKKLLKLLKKMSAMRTAANSYTPEYILYTKDGYAVHKMSTHFYLKKKRNPKNTKTHHDTYLSLLFETEPHCSIVLLLETSQLRKRNRVAFRIYELDQVIDILDKILTADDGIVFSTISAKEEKEMKQQYTVKLCPQCGGEPGDVSMSTTGRNSATCKLCGFKWSQLYEKKVQL
jgi:predicted RNA-binding Zn-ribbon protein involved in translation (DUF1610 family)